jgi:hypothetical protein
MKVLEEGDQIPQYGMVFWEDEQWWPVKLSGMKGTIVTMKFADGGQTNQSICALPLVPLLPWEPQQGQSVDIWKRKEKKWCSGEVSGPSAKGEAYFNIRFLGSEKEELIKFDILSWRDPITVNECKALFSK